MIEILGIIVLGAVFICLPVGAVVVAIIVYRSMHKNGHDK